MEKGIKHYISAYGIAVKHGFKGTEEEWLESICGGNAELRYNSEGGCIEYKHTRAEEWSILISLADLRGDIAQDIINAVNDSVERAELAATSAGDSAGVADRAKSRAVTAETNAKASAASAEISANNAAQNAKTAAEAMCNEKLGAVMLKLNSIESGANKTVVDKEFSENSENPVANYILLEALRTKLNSVTFNAHKGDKRNPHGVSASQVGAYTKAEADAAIKAAIDGISGISEDVRAELNTKADIAQVFEEGSFRLTEFKLTESREGVESEEMMYFDVTESEIYGSQSGAVLVIHCKGEVLGFTASLTEGSELCRLKVNGKYVIDYLYGEGETEYATEPVLMTEDIEVELNIMSAVSFADMKKRTIKGMGDIASALDEIKTLQRAYIDGGAE